MEQLKLFILEYSITEGFTFNEKKYDIEKEDEYKFILKNGTKVYKRQLNNAFVFHGNYVLYTENEKMLDHFSLLIDFAEESIFSYKRHYDEKMKCLDTAKKNLKLMYEKCDFSNAKVS